jgi:hypothetical protein
MAVYLVRSSRTYARIRSLTTGTFNLVVKDRIAFRLSGAPSVQANSHKCESDCPRNPTTIPCSAKPCQSAHPTEFPRVFHIGKGGVEGRPGSLAGSKGRNGMAFRFASADFGARLFQPREGGRQKIEKRPYVWRFLALKVPFRNSLMFPNQVPWPGRLESLTPSHLLRCRTRDESCRQYARLATHCSR